MEKNVIKESESWPILEIESVFLPAVDNAPFEIVFKIKTNGTTPTTTAGKDLVIKILNDSTRRLFGGTPNFPNEKREVFVLQPGESIQLKAKVLPDNLDNE